MADDAIAPEIQEAIDALREGNKTKARELFTGLLKTDQNNATLWVWMSATVDNTKERIYCLQTAYKLDPENESAKRGLILLGALTPDESIKPFPLNRPRAWEQKLLLAHEKPKLKGWAAVRASPITRLVGILGIVAAMGAVVYFGVIAPRAQQQRPPTNTPGPSPTLTSTPTALNATGRPDAQGTLPPLSELLDQPYTPTALYVVTERPPISADNYLRFERAFARGEWDEAIEALQAVIALEPEAADAYYYLGEVYRFKGEPTNAADAYNIAISINGDFGAAYVGLARARLLADPNADVLTLLDEGIRLDPNFGEAYLERAKIKLRDNDIDGAIADLGKADQLLPNSPLVYYTLAVTRQREGEFELALKTAQRANQLDLTHLPTYLLLGELHAALGDNEQAAIAFNTYLTYNEGDTNAYLLYGKIQFANGEYEETIRLMDQVLSIERNRREAYLYRFYSHLELNNADEAQDDADVIFQAYSQDFEYAVAYLRLDLLQERNGNALLSLERLLALAETDEQKGITYYWGGVVHERRKELDEAADYWQLLLELPEEATTEEMRDIATEHFYDIRTATPAPTSTRTRTPTPTKPITGTVTKVATPSPTPSPTRTPTPTRTPSPTPTK